MLKRVQCGFVILTAVVFTAANLVSGENRIAVFSFACGVIWIVLEAKEQRRLVSLFFVAYAGMAVVGVLNQYSVPIMAFGLSMDLAAWDLSRLLDRAALAPRNDQYAKLGKRHLRLLLATIGAGLALVLPASVVRIPMNFLLASLLVLCIVAMLRKSLEYLRVG